MGAEQQGTASIRELAVPIPNRTFLEHVFADTADALWVCAFKGDPSQALSGTWGGASYHLGDDLWDELKRENAARFNTYFCISTFKRGSTGRRLENFAANYCVVLDDVGQKMPLRELKLAPSWVLETSPQNYQVGYLWKEPITDAALATAVVNAACANGLSDPSAHSVSRYARLPDGTNFKAQYERPFRHVMRVCKTQRRYTPREFLDAHGLVVDVSSTSARKPIAEFRTLATNGAAQGGRNCSSASLAGHVLSSFLDPVVARELLVAWATSRCSPPMTEAEAVATVNSIAAKELQKRRDVRSD